MEGATIRNNFVTEAASVFKGRVAQEDETPPKTPSRQYVKVSFGAPGNVPRTG